MTMSTLVSREDLLYASKIFTRVVLEKILLFYSATLKFRLRKDEKLLEPSHCEERCVTQNKTNLVYICVTNSTSKTK